MFDIPGVKTFMDVVHGYIQIPHCFVEHIIDTLYFQRLRNIDQTGMRILYPNAKHDRFSGYSEDLTIDRINNDGNYEPSNCRWSTNIEQSRNRGLYLNNKSGISGVNYDKNIKKWISRIGVNNNQIYLGCYNNFEKAVEIRKNAEKEYWQK